MSKNQSSIPIIKTSSVVINQDKPALEAVKIIDSSDGKISIVVDTHGTIVGSVTDGDIRRGILNGYSLEWSVSVFMNHNPIVLPSSSTRQLILEKMVLFDIKQVPLANEDGKIIGITTYSLLQEEQHLALDNPIIVMAGGKGQRLLPITKDIPKPMIEIGGRPILELIIQRFHSHGFSNFYFAINHLGGIIEDYFADGSKFGCKIEYLRENKILGTAGALSLLNKNINNDFIVINGDILTSVDFNDFLDYHTKNNNIATVCTRTHLTEIPYGVLQLDDNKIVNNIIEKPVYESQISAGIYAFNTKVLDYLKDDTYVDMPNLIMDLIADQQKVGAYFLKDEWVDIGRHDDLQKARDSFIEDCSDS